MSEWWTREVSKWDQYLKQQAAQAPQAPEPQVKAPDLPAWTPQEPEIPAYPSVNQQWGWRLPGQQIPTQPQPSPSVSPLRARLSGVYTPRPPRIQPETAELPPMPEGAPEYVPTGGRPQDAVYRLMAQQVLPEWMTDTDQYMGWAPRWMQQAARVMGRATTDAAIRVMEAYRKPDERQALFAPPTTKELGEMWSPQQQEERRKQATADLPEWLRTAYSMGGPARGAVEAYIQAQTALPAIGKTWERISAESPQATQLEKLAGAGADLVQESALLAEQGFGTTRILMDRRSKELDVEDWYALTPVTWSLVYRQGEAAYNAYKANVAAGMGEAQASLYGAMFPERSVYDEVLQKLVDGTATADEIAQAEYSFGAEFVGQAGVDPLNVLDWIGAGRIIGEASKLARTRRMMAHLDEYPELKRSLAVLEAGIRRTSDMEVDALERAAITKGVELVTPAEDVKTFWQRLKGSWNPFELTPAAKAERDAGETWLALAGPISAMKTPQEALELLTTWAKQPDALTGVLGNLPMSLAGQKASLLLDDLADAIPKFSSMQDATFNPAKFMLELDDIMIPRLRAAYGYTAPTGIAKFINAYKGLMSEFYLTAIYSPGYALRNTASDMFTMAVDGLMTFESNENILKWFDDVGGIPSRRITTGGKGIREELTGVADESSRLPGVAGEISKKGQRIVREAEPLGRIPIGEEPRYRRAFYSAAKKFFDKNAVAMTPELGDAVKAKLGTLADDLRVAAARAMTPEAKRAAVTRILDATNPAQGLEPLKYLSDQQLDAMSPELYKTLVDKLQELGPGATPDDLTSTFEEVRELVAADEARRLKDLETTPRLTVSTDADEMGLADDLINDIEEAVSRVEDPEIRATLEDDLVRLKEEIPQVEEALDRARVELVEAIKEQGDADGLDVLLAVNRDSEAMRDETRKLLDELRINATAEYQADPKMGSAIWPQYFTDSSKGWKDLAQQRIGRYDTGREQLARIMAGESADDILGMSRRELAELRMRRASMVDIPEAPAGYIPGKVLDASENRKFEAFLKAQRGATDAAQSNAWRAAYGAQPAHFGHVVDTLDSAGRDVELWGKVTAGQVRDALEKTQRDAGKAYQRTYRATKGTRKQKQAAGRLASDAVWEKYYAIRNDLWRKLHESTINRWKIAERDILVENWKGGPRMEAPARVPTPAEAATEAAAERAAEATAATMAADLETVKGALLKDESLWSQAEKQAVARWTGAGNALPKVEQPLLPASKNYPAYTREQFREDLIGRVGLGKAEADATMALTDARARVWSAWTGRDPSEWYATRLAGLEGPGMVLPPDLLYQRAPSPMDMDGAELISQIEARGGLRLNADQMAEILGSETPEYLRPIVDYMTEQRAKLVAGRLTRRDVAKAILLNSSSQRASEMSLDVFSAGLKKQKIKPFAVPENFILDKAGKAYLRPEDAMGAWLLSPSGRRALDKLERGIYDARLWEEAGKVRRIWGYDVLAGHGVFGGKRGYGLDRIGELTDKINALGPTLAENMDQMDALLGQVAGVGQAKLGFYKHLLGMGDTPTIDAVEVNAWLTGTGRIKDLGLDREIATRLKQLQTSLAWITDKIGDQFQALGKMGLASDVDPALRNHILHHWIWDSFKGTTTSQQAMYDAMRYAQRGASTLSPKQAKRLANLTAKSSLTLEELKEAKRLTALGRETAETLFQTVEAAPAPRWYYQAENILQQKMPNRADARQVKNILTKGGVRKDELEWSGIIQWLDEQKGSLSKEDVLGYLQENRLQVVDVTSGGLGDTAAQQRMMALEDELMAKGWTPEYAPSGLDEDYYLEFFYDPDGNTIYASDLPRLRQTDPETARQLSEAFDLESVIKDEAPKYPKYVEPGGKGYTELRITLPAERLDMDFDQWMIEKGPGHTIAEGEEGYNLWQRTWQQQIAPGQDVYKGPHWNDPNVVSHVRFNDRIGPNGERVLFIEEIQSDWHQKGRQIGYKPKGGFTELPKEFELVLERAGPQYNAAGGLIGENSWRLIKPDDPEWFTPYRWVGATKEEAAVDALRTLNASNMAGVPTGPFAKSWDELTLKRMYRWAAENGYDQIAWTTGKTQVDRYGLQKIVDRLEWTSRKDTVSGITLYDVRGTKDGEQILDLATMTRDNMRDKVGKEIANQILEGGESGVIEGDALKVGGQGMEQFYDQILPYSAKQTGKRWALDPQLSEVMTARYQIISTSEWDELAGMHSSRFANKDRPWAVVDMDNPNVGTAYRTREEAEAYLRGDWNIPPEQRLQAWVVDISPEMRRDLLSEGLPLFQQQGVKKGAVQFLEDGRAVIHAFEAADVSTVVHELGHVFRRELEAEDLDLISRWVEREGQRLNVLAKDGQLDARLKSRLFVDQNGNPVDVVQSINADRSLTRAGEEMFSSAFERYLAGGDAPVPELQGIFERFKDWLRQIYHNLTGSEIDLNVRDDVKAVFDRLVSEDPPVRPGDLAGQERLFVARSEAAEAIAKARLAREPLSVDDAAELMGTGDDWDALADKLWKEHIRAREFSDPEGLDNAAHMWSHSGEKKPVEVGGYFTESNRVKSVKAEAEYRRSLMGHLRHDPKEFYRRQRDLAQWYNTLWQDANRKAMGLPVKPRTPPEWLAKESIEAAEQLQQYGEEGAQLFQTEAPKVSGSAAKREKPKFGRQPGAEQMGMFDETYEDLPLVSGVGASGQVGAFTPGETGAQVALPGMELEIGEKAKYAARPAGAEAAEEVDELAALRPPEIPEGQGTLFQTGDSGDIQAQPAFRRWFGKSQVKQANGRPKGMYRAGDGLQFTDTPTGQDAYAVYLRVENPYISQGGELPDMQQLRQAGYDGIVERGKRETWTVFDTDQIKSAPDQAGPWGSALEDAGIHPTLWELYQEETAKAGATHGPSVADVAQGSRAATDDALDTMQGGMLGEWSQWQKQGVNQAQRQQVMNWLEQDVIPNWWETRAVGLGYAKASADDALLNYSNRRNFDTWLNLIFPYHFWFTRSGKNWAKRLAARPGMVAGYLRTRDAMKLANEQAGRRQRFEGKIKVPFPWLPEWAGDAIYVDPLRFVLPFANLYGNNWDDADEGAKGLRKIFGLIEQSGFRPYHFWELPYRAGWLQKAGEAAGMTPEQAKEYLGPEYQGGFPYVLPQTGAIKAATAGLRQLGVGGIPAGGVNIEAAARKAIGLPGGDVFDPYRVNRMLGNLSAMDAQNPQLAQQAMMAQALMEADPNQQGRPWEPTSPIGQQVASMYNWTPDQLAGAQAMLSEAVQKAALERGVGAIGWALGPSMTIQPEGERRQMELQRMQQATAWTPDQPWGSRELYNQTKEAFPAVYPRATQYNVLPGESQYQAMAPGARANWMQAKQAKATLNQQIDQQVDELLRREPWNWAGRGQLEEQRKAGIDQIEKQFPIPPMTGDMPAILYGMTPTEMWDATAETEMRSWEITEPKPDAFAQADGQVNWGAYYDAHDQWKATLPTGWTQPLRGGKYMGLDPVTAWENYDQRFDSPLEAAYKTYQEQVAAPAWDAYNASKGQKGAFMNTVGQVGEVPADVLIPAILEQYQTQGWTPQQLSQELTGVVFPPLKDWKALKEGAKGEAGASGAKGYTDKYSSTTREEMAARVQAEGWRAVYGLPWWEKYKSGGGGGGGGGKKKASQYPPSSWGSGGRWKPPRTIRGGPWQF